MKKFVKRMLMVTAVLFLCIIPVRADAASWVKNPDGSYSCYEDGKLLKSQRVGNYYVDSSGRMVTNRWVKRRFYGDDGKYIKQFKGGWQQIQGNWYYYSASGQKRIGWLTKNGRKYYFNEDGVLQTRWTEIDGVTYYFHTRKGYMLTGMWKIRGKYYYFSNTGEQIFGWMRKGSNTYYFDPETGERTTSFREIDGNTYYFNSVGVMKVGWTRINGEKYFFSKNKNGVILTGLQKISGKLYYFDKDGVLQTNTTITVNDQTYSVDGSGVCTEKYSGVTSGVSDTMLFFTLFESGGDAYGQVGGDNGSACGKYQFDYRYSLLPFIKYCYSSDPTFFKEFKTFARYTDSQKYKLKSNTKLYSAWRKIYNRDRDRFKAYQDSYAKQEYYDVTERVLSSTFGISLAGRPDVVKGAVFSYSIQHGQTSAALAVKNAGIKNSTSNKQFLQKLYQYRIKQYPAYKTRYNSELSLALSLL